LRIDGKGKRLLSSLRPGTRKKIPSPPGRDGGDLPRREAGRSKWEVPTAPPPPLATPFTSPDHRPPQEPQKRARAEKEARCARLIAQAYLIDPRSAPPAESACASWPPSRVGPHRAPPSSPPLSRSPLEAGPRGPRVSYDRRSTGPRRPTSPRRGLSEAIDPSHPGVDFDLPPMTTGWGEARPTGERGTLPVVDFFDSPRPADSICRGQRASGSVQQVVSAALGARAPLVSLRFSLQALRIQSYTF